MYHDNFCKRGSMSVHFHRGLCHERTCWVPNKTSDPTGCEEY